MTERPSAGVRRALSLLVGIGLLTAVVWRLGLTTFLQALGELPLGVLPLAVAIGAVPPVCYAWRWRRILELADQPISLVEALRVTVAATTANYLVPAFGWAPAKIVLARRWLRMGVTQTVPSVVLEQLIDLTVLAVLGGSGLVLIGKLPIPLRSGTFAVFAAVVVAVVLLLGVLGSVVRRGRLTRMRRLLSVSWLFVATMLGDPLVWSATAGRWAAELFVLGLLAALSGLQIGWAGLIVLLALPALVGALVPIPGGIGIREASGVAIAAWLGIDPAVAGAILVWHRAVTLLGLAGVGVVSAVAGEARP